MAKFKYVGAVDEGFDYCLIDEPNGYKWTLSAWRDVPEQRFRLIYSNAAGEGYAGFAVCIRRGPKKVAK